MSNPILSIIVACHNVATKIEPLLTSLHSIRRDDVEVIFVNDCSTDGTSAVLSEFERLSPLKVKILEGNYLGPGGARNAGLQTASSAYVWLVDADDRLHPAPVLARLEEIESVSTDIIAFKVKEAEVPDSLASFGSSSDFANWLKFGRVYGKIIRRSIIPESPYPELVFNGEDNVATLLISLNVKSYLIYEEVCYEVIPTPQSLTRGDFSQRYLLRWKAGEDILRIARARVSLGELPDFERQVVWATIDSTWSYYLHHGRLKELFALMPRLLSTMRQLGLISKLRSFMATGSRKNRILKRLAVWPALPISFLYRCTVDDLVADVANETLRQRKAACPRSGTSTGRVSPPADGRDEPTHS